jgi:hypothetical protein
MKLDLGWLYISIDRYGIHIELERYPKLWFVISLNTNIDGYYKDVLEID